MRSLSILALLSSAFWPLQCTVISVPRSGETPTASSHISLVKKQSSPPLRLGRRDTTANVGITGDAGFWFGEFTIGGKSKISMLIDTGSGDLVLNPGVYVPGKSSQALNMTFANSYGTTESNGTGTTIVTGELRRDQVSFGGLTAQQVIGSMTGSDQSPVPGSGIAGFSGQIFAQFPTNSTSFFQTLCTEKKVSQCRFGLVLQANGTGTQVLGELDTTLYDGELSTAPIITPWVVSGDVVVDGKVMATDQVIEMDSGTATVVGPIAVITKIFNATGVQGVLHPSPEGDILVGYFPCDKPPTVGFNFPSAANASAAAADASIPSSDKSSTFHIPSGSWATKDLGNNNCTSVMSGQDYAAFPGLWVVGQPFFHGLYIDHNLENGTMGFATAATLPPQTSNAVSNLSAAMMRPIIACLVLIFLL